AMGALCDGGRDHVVEPTLYFLLFLTRRRGDRSGSPLRGTVGSPDAQRSVSFTFMSAIRMKPFFFSRSLFPAMNSMNLAISPEAAPFVNMCSYDQKGYLPVITFASLAGTPSMASSRIPVWPFVPENAA